MFSKVGVIGKSGLGCGVQSADGRWTKTTTSTIIKASPRPVRRDTLETRTRTSLRRLHSTSHENNLDELPGAGYTRSGAEPPGGDDRRV